MEMLRRVSSSLAASQHRVWSADAKASRSRMYTGNLEAAVLLEAGQSLVEAGATIKNAPTVILGLDMGGLGMIGAALTMFQPVDVRYLGDMPRTIEYLTSPLNQGVPASTETIVILLGHEIREADSVLATIEQIRAAVPAATIVAAFLTIGETVLEQLKQLDSVHVAYVGTD